MDTTDYKVADETVFPDNFPDVGGKTFIWTWKHKKEWVEFTNGMVGTTGLFKAWYDYCQRKL
jgi:hypothetical protein